MLRSQGRSLRLLSTTKDPGDEVGTDPGPQFSEPEPTKMERALVDD